MSVLETQIANRVRAFVEEITDLARKTAVDLLNGNFTAKVAAAPKAAPAPKAAAPAAKAPKAPKAAKASSGGKRSGAELEKLVARVLKEISDKPGQRMEHINRAVGLPTKDLVLPIKKLLAEGKIRSQGERRATQYFPADAAGKKAAAKKR